MLEPMPGLLSYCNNSLFIEILLRIFFSLPVNLTIMAFFVLGPIACAVMEILACGIVSIKATVGTDGLTRAASGVVQGVGRKEKIKGSFLSKLENALTFNISMKAFIKIFLIGQPWHLQDDSDWIDIKDTLAETKLITDLTESIAATAGTEPTVAKKFAYDSPKTPIKRVSRVLRVLNTQPDATKATILTITIDQVPLGSESKGGITGENNVNGAAPTSTEPIPSLPTTPARSQGDVCRGRRSPNPSSGGPSAPNNTTISGTPTQSSTESCTKRNSRSPTPTRRSPPPCTKRNTRYLTPKRCSSPSSTVGRTKPQTPIKPSLIPTLRHHSLLSKQVEQAASPPSTPIKPIKRGNSFDFLPHSPTSPSTTKVDGKLVAVTSIFGDPTSKIPIRKTPKVKRG